MLNLCLVVSNIAKQPHACCVLKLKCSNLLNFLAIGYLTVTKLNKFGNINVVVKRSVVPAIILR